MPDFRFKSQFPVAQVAQLIADKKMKEQQMELAKKQDRRQRLDSLLNALTTSAQLARSFQDMKSQKLAQQQAQSEMAGRNDVMNIIGEPSPQAPITRPIESYSPTQGPSLLGNALQPQISRSIQPTFGQTGSYDPETNQVSPLGSTQSQRLQQALVKGFSTQAADRLTKQAFPDPPDKFKEMKNALSAQKDLIQLEDAELNRLYKRTLIKSMENKENGTKKTTPKQLESSRVLTVNEGAAIANKLPDITALLDSSADLFGPIMGAARSFNPYDKKAQTVQSEIKTTSQAFGRYMEGGVLRKEDEAKYLKMFPQLNDTIEVAKSKLLNIQRILALKQNSDLDALQRSGYDTSGFNPLPVPQSLAERTSDGRPPLDSFKR